MTPRFLAWVSWGIVGQCTKSIHRKKGFMGGSRGNWFSLGHNEFEVPLGHSS